MSSANEPAYPVLNYSEAQYPGLTKREMFAMAAMQGFCANPDEQISRSDVGPIANWAVAQADAVLAEIAKELT